MNKSAAAVVRWWVIVGEVLLFLVLPGPSRSALSGAPLASKALILFLAVMLLAVFSLFYVPRRLVRLRWIAVIAVLIAGKIAVAPLLVPTGWRGTYWTAIDWTLDSTQLRRADFVTERRVRPYRIDRAIAFDGRSFSLDFLNDLPSGRRDIALVARDVDLPLRVRWEGWNVEDTAHLLTISCRGRVTVIAGGTTFLAANDVAGRTVSIPANSEKIVIDYEKPAKTEPLMIVGDAGGVVAPRPSSSGELARARWASTAIAGFGFVLFTVLAIGFAEAYGPLRPLLDRVASDPAAAVTFALIAVFVAAAAKHTISLRHLTMVMGAFDDPLFYEGQARLIVRHGLLMTNAPAGHGDPYYFYPLYSYALAFAHLIFGEDFANTILFNWLCLPVVIGVFWSVLRKYVGASTVIIVVVLVALFERSTMISTPYTESAFSDNLFSPLALGAVAAAISATERRRGSRFVAAGALSALAAAARPSFLLFVPCFGLWLVLDRKLGRFARRIVFAAFFGAGFAAAVAPFTIRNWIVSRKFVPLVNAYVNIPLYVTPPGEPTLRINTDGHLPTLGEAVAVAGRYALTHPMPALATAARKVGFTFGMPWMSPGPDPPIYFLLLPLSFAAAVWLRRVPRDFAAVVAVFLVSHVIAMLMAAPWTYGDKTILPFHLVLFTGVGFLIPAVRKGWIVVATAAPPEAMGAPRVAAIAFDEATTVTALRAAIAGADADYVLFARQATPDGDVGKLLAYANEFDVVDGVGHYAAAADDRTTLRAIHWAAAKYIGMLYGDPGLVNADGSLRLMRRDMANDIAATLTTSGWRAGVEMTVAVLENGCSLIQVPVRDHAVPDDLSVAAAFRAMWFATKLWSRSQRRRPRQR